MTAKERRVKAQHIASRTSQQATNQRVIDGLMHEVAMNPKLDKELSRQARTSWGWTGKSLYRTALRRKMV